MVEIVVSNVFNPKAPHEIMCGEPGVMFKQNGRYFNQAGKLATLTLRDKRSKAEQERDALAEQIKELQTENAQLQGQYSKLLLQVTTPVVPAAPPVAEAPIIVDGAALK